MKAAFIITVGAIIGITLITGCGDTAKEAGTVDVAGAIANPTELKVSDLGETITYVPLATTDSSLVGQSWGVTVTDDLALVRNSGSIMALGTTGNGVGVMAFSLADGRYLNHVGHGGQDGEAYMLPFFTVDAKTNTLTFDAANDKRVKYSGDGRFLGTYPKHIISASTPRPTIVDDTIGITALQNLPGQGDPYLSIIFTSESGRLLDSIQVVSAENPSLMPFFSIDGGMTFDTFDGFIPHSQAGGMAFIQQGKPSLYRSPAPSLWSVGNEYHALMEFTDTIYSVAMNRAPEATLIFDMGGQGYPPADNGKRDMTDKDLMIGEIIESTSTLIFGVSKGWNKKDNAFIGLYDKKSGTTRATKASNGFVDDLGGFMPFFPVTITPDGRYVGIITQEDIAKWMEEHPEAKVPESLQEIVDSEEEPNPVLVIVK